MHNTLLNIAAMVVNDDLAALANYLAFMEVGDTIDTAEAARVLGLDEHVVIFLCDTLAELGAIVGPAPLPPSGEVLSLAA